MDFMHLCSPQILDSPKNGHDSHFEPAHHIELDKTRVPPTWNAAARCCRNFVAVVPGCFFWKPFISVSRRFLLVGNKFRKELGINSCWKSILRPQFSRISHEFFDVNFIINFLLFIFCWESSDLPLPHPSVPVFCLIRLLQVSIDLLEGFHSGSQAFILLASNLFLFSLRDIQVEFPKILGSNLSNLTLKNTGVMPFSSFAKQHHRWPLMIDYHKSLNSKAGCCSFMDFAFLIEDQLASLTCWIQCKALVIKGANVLQCFPTAWSKKNMDWLTGCSSLNYITSWIFDHPTTCIRCSFDSPAWTSRKSLHPETAKWHISYTSPYFGAWADCAVLHVSVAKMNIICQNSSAWVLRCAAETVTGIAQKATTTSGQSPPQST